MPSHAMAFNDRSLATQEGRKKVPLNIYDPEYCLSARISGEKKTTKIKQIYQNKWFIKINLLILVSG